MKIETFDSLNNTNVELIGRSKLKNVWMLSFESSDVAQLGGLGPAVATLSKAISGEMQVSVFMPSHGRQNDPKIREKLALNEIRGLSIEGSRRGVDRNFYPYKIGLEKGTFHKVNYFLVKGLDDETRKWLDDPQIYDGELTFQKMALFARALEGYLKLVVRDDPDAIPDIIHAHDWHVVPASIALKQIAMNNHANVPLIYTIHLLSGKGLPWHYMSDEWCGIKDETHCISFGGANRLATYREVWDDMSGGRFEKFGALESDLITTVSRTYLESDVIPCVGPGVKEKSGYIYNGCDWDEETISRNVKREHAANLNSIEFTRSNFRKYLLTRALGEMRAPTILESDVRIVVETSYSSFGNKSLEPFADDGELVLMTGRLDPQKGVDILLKAVPEVLGTVPSAKFLLLLIPILQKEFIDSAISEASRYPNNVRLILGRAPQIYTLAHVSGDTYAMPSRWEPFGLSALEAMATGNPVAGTRVGGITETVLDIFEHAGKGTGHLVSKDDYKELAKSLISFLLMMKIDQKKREGTGKTSVLLDKIPYDQVREIVARDPSAGSKIRDNCRMLVKNQFSPDSAGRMAMNAYERAQTISSQRMS